MKKTAASLMALGLAASLASESKNDFTHEYEMELSKPIRRATNLTKKQSKVRAKNKLARKSRKVNQKTK